MPAPLELISLSHVLNELLVKGRAVYERAVRAVRWGELPVWAVASAHSLPAAEALQYAFEDLLSWPLIVHEAASFAATASAMLRPGSVVVVFDDGTAPAQDALRAARKRTVQVVVIDSGSAAPATDSLSPMPVADSPLTLMLPPAGASARGGLGAACLQHAAAAQLALVCARHLTRPDARLERCEREWRDVPSQIDGLAAPLDRGVAALAGELKSHDLMLFVGGGHYSAIVRRMSGLGRQHYRRLMIGLDLGAFDGGWLEVLGMKPAVLLVSGSSGRLAKATVALAGAIKERGCPLSVITGANNQDLIRQAHVSLMLPETGDFAGSILALAVVGWVTSQVGR